MIPFVLKYHVWEGYRFISLSLDQFVWTTFDSDSSSDNASLVCSGLVYRPKTGFYLEERLSRSVFTALNSDSSFADPYFDFFSTFEQNYVETSSIFFGMS